MSLRYAVCVASDCNGSKANLQFFFDHYGPSTAQLLSRACECFSRIFEMRSIYRTFAISSAVIFNDLTHTWDRLERSSQLVHNCQVYLFQPDVLDVPGEIPDPIPATQFLSNYCSPPRETYSVSPRAKPPVTYYERQPVSYQSPIYYESQISTPQRHILSVDPSWREKILREQDAHRGETVPGGSILQEERMKEEQKLNMPLDQHRECVRRETREFSNSMSPQRTH